MLTHCPLHFCIPGGQPHTPFAHTSGGVHTLPQPPQLFMSYVMLTHCPLHFCIHTPFAHTSGGVHTLPQPPQLFTSYVMSEHWPLHLIWPGKHWQVPLTQVPVPQDTPQEPQFIGSELRNVHPWLQPVMPGGQGKQLPPWHIALPEQALPQLPQFFWSKNTSMHLPPQDWNGGEHEAWHCPPLQKPPEAQVVEQLPQWLGLVCVSIHSPLHAVSPAPHWSAHAPCEQT